jgi:hypothetical protein
LSSFFATQKKKPQDDDQPFSLSFFVIEEKNTKDELGGLSSSFVNIKHLVGPSSMPTHIQTRGWSFLPTPI